ncbi:ubiquitin-like small modifier protein 1 [Pelomicrobium methylotrophicum]|uniref:MoaD/ThiS family protein n=1 Tax=Pelomicrobium methylotrophicum TaxID=2602750 RepID=A0A5C7ELV8_9PROT|nr:ubiquitin-like small modifier protein 1 [Pelomicrobium methylotrophicum]TXF12393.1 MoaD/ThiS family protein [Pelomicrobium methylotrophicum]
MSTVKIRIPMPLRTYTGGAEEVEVTAATVGEALQALGRRYEGLLPRVLGPDGELRQFVNVFVAGRNVRSLSGLATPIADGDVVSIVPAVAGGGRGARDRAPVQRGVG